MNPNMGYWQEKLYASTHLYDTDSKFWENMGKSSYLEGKMGAREMAFSKGGGLPTLNPLPPGQPGNP